jgi:hypothetical protein
MLSCLIVVSLLAGVVQPASAISEFSLLNGTLTTGGEDTYEDSFINFWRNLRIDFTDNGSGVLTGFGQASASATDDSGLETITTSGQVSGTFDPQTGLLSGEYSVTFHSVFHKETESTTTHYETTRVYSGSHETQLQAGAPSVEIKFRGSMTQEVTGDYPKGWTANGETLNFTMDWGIGVQFTVDGTIEVAIPTEAAVKQEFPDSGARFSDLSGQVEVLIPTGIDENGQYLYEDEVWTLAKLDMVLPEGTHIRTQDRSSVILSFADITTFEQKDDTEIILLPPGPKKSQFQLLYGALAVGVKNMLKDGSMEIEMSQAVAGIKGTILVLSDDGTSSTLKVMEGSVEFISRATGAIQMVSAGQMLSADANGLGDLQTFDVATERQSWPSLSAETEPAAQPVDAPAQKLDLKLVLIAIVCLAGLVGVVVVGLLGYLFIRRKK